MSQIKYLQADVGRILGKNKWRILILPFSRIFVGIFWYRVDRSLYLLMGEYYKIIRLLLSPFFLIIQFYTNIDIHYTSDIGPGLLILHPSVGIVVSGKIIAGKNLTLTGGNVIGMNENTGNIILGDNCTLGTNACIIGPLTLGNHIQIGALACVVKSFKQDNLTLVGVPAKILI